MGAAPSLAKFLRSMEDEELTDTIEEVRARALLLPVQLVLFCLSVCMHLTLTRGVLFDWRQAYHLDPQRIERIFTIAKLRYLESAFLSHVGVCVGVSKVA